MTVQVQVGCVRSLHHVGKLKVKTVAPTEIVQSLRGIEEVLGVMCSYVQRVGGSAIRNQTKGKLMKISDSRCYWD